MGNPVQGYGPSADDRYRERKFQNITIILAMFSLAVAIGVGIATIFLAHHTDEAVMTLTEINKKQLEIITQDPYAEGLGLKIYLENKPPSEPKIYYGEVIIITASNHPLKITIKNSTLEDISSTDCYFENKPKIEQLASWTAIVRPTDTDSSVKAALKIDYLPKEKFRNLEAISDIAEVNVGFVDYQILVKDLQTNKTKIIEPYSFLTVNLPIQYADSDLCN